MDEITLTLAVAALASLYLAWNAGASDLANALGTAVGAGALSHLRAIVLGGGFAALGALLASHAVFRTVEHGLLDLQGLSPERVALGMASALAATFTWVLLARRLELTVSVAHASVGAIVGAGLALGGPRGVEWATVGRVAFGWALAPFVAGFLAHESFSFLNRHVIGTRHPVIRLRRSGPVFTSVTIGLAATVTLYGERLGFDLEHALLGGVAIGLFSAIPTLLVLMRPGFLRGRRTHRAERAFLGLQATTACVLAFSIGANDLPTIVAPLAATLEVLSPSRASALDLIVVSSVALGLGLWTVGYQVLESVTHQVELTPSRGLAAEFGASVVLLSATGLGLPVSSIHVLVGAVVGVSIARSVGALNLEVLRSIASSLVATLPATLALGAVLAGLASWFTR